MRCETCEAVLSPGRLFCQGCGAVSPEGLAVMSADPGRPSPAPLPATVGTPAHLPDRPPRPGHPAAATSSTAVVSLLFGLLSYLALPLVGAVIAVVTGHAARREIRVSGGRLEGQLLASLGLALGYSQFVLAGLFVVFLFGLGALVLATMG